MTPEQIINELELLKDYTNDHGKGVLGRVQQELRAHFAMPPAVIEKVVEKKVEVPVAAPGDRRGEPRDPAEHEQHVAEKLGLAPKAHK